MTVLEMQVDDMLTHGVHSVLPHYVYYKERTKLDVTPDGVRRSKLKKDNALEHLQRYFSLYLQYFTSNLADGENPLYLFQLGKIDQKLYRALFDFSSNYPDQLPQISKLIPNEFDRGNNLLKNESVSANAVATFYWAKRYRSNKRNINDT